MKNKKVTEPTHRGTPINGKYYFPLRKQYRGCLGERNLPPFPANTFVMQSLSGIVHFHYGLN